VQGLGHEREVETLADGFADGAELLEVHELGGAASSASAVERLQPEEGRADDNADGPATALAGTGQADTGVALAHIGAGVVRPGKAQVSERADHVRLVAEVRHGLKAPLRRAVGARQAVLGAGS
ncbi:MAG: hypothetical protein ACK5PF_12210, partial [bacterium]